MHTILTATSKNNKRLRVFVSRVVTKRRASMVKAKRRASRVFNRKQT